MKQGIFKRSFTFLFASSILFSGCYQQNQPQADLNISITPNDKLIVFHKKESGSYVYSELTLYNDSSYCEYTEATSSVDRSKASNTITGHFTVSGEKLFLTPEKLSAKEYHGKSFTVTGTDSIKNKIYYCATEYNIIAYNKLLILLNDSIYPNNITNDFIEIANSINEHDGPADIHYYYKNSEQSNITVDKDIAKKFQSPWNEYILDAPVFGKLTGIKKADHADRELYDDLYMYSQYIFTLDIGSEDGIRNGMNLFSFGKDSCSCEMTIMETEKNQCKGYLAPFYETNCMSATEYSTKRK